MTTENLTHSNADLVARYVELRDKKAEIEAAHKATIAKYTEAMDRLERHFLNHLNETSSESVATVAGTFFKSETVSAKVEDWDQTLPFIRDNGLWNMLDKRVNKTAIKEYMDANGDLPPGVGLHREIVVRVRRA